MAEASDPTQNASEGRIISEDQFELCCSNKKGCPIIEKIPGGFVLSEHGEAVRLTDAQAELLSRWMQSRLKNDPA